MDGRGIDAHRAREVGLERRRQLRRAPRVGDKDAALCVEGEGARVEVIRLA